MADSHAKLGEILIAVKEAELARFAQIASQKGRILMRLESLENDRLNAIQLAANADSLQPSRILSSDEKWMRWVDNQRQELGHELARLAALEEEQRLRSATALGKVRAFEKMIEKLGKQRPERGS